MMVSSTAGLLVSYIESSKPAAEAAAAVKAAQSQHVACWEVLSRTDIGCGKSSSKQQLKQQQQRMACNRSKGE
jgi:hypothetical protein